jgi:AhpD family alkylhydroperoxidase
MTPGDAPPPRVPPGGRREIGIINVAVTRIIGVATGSGPPNVFTTLARHRGLFRRWLWFAGALMPGGLLPRRDSELVILRVAENCRCEYEWRHHERLGRTAGLTAEQIQRVREGPDADGWSARERLLLRAADELHTERDVSGELWGELRPMLSDTELIELCLLIGHYEMLAMTLNALRVAPDVLPPGPPSRVGRALQGAVEQRQRKRRTA